MSSPRGPRGPLDSMIVLALGLMFWATLLIGLPTFAEWLSRSW